MSRLRWVHPQKPKFRTVSRFLTYVSQLADCPLLRLSSAKIKWSVVRVPINFDADAHNVTSESHEMLPPYSAAPSQTSKTACYHTVIQDFFLSAIL